MIQKHKDLCETHIIGQKCQESFLPTGDRPCQPLAAADVSLAGLSNLAGTYRISRIAPNFHAVLVTLGGKGILRTAHESCALTVRSLAVLPAGTSYLYELKSPMWRVAWFHLKRRKRWRAIEAAQPSVREFTRANEIENSMQAILRESHSRDITSLRMVELHSELLVYSLERELGNFPDARSSRHEEPLKNLWREVNENLSKQWTIHEMSRRLHVVPGHFHRIVHDLHDATPMQMVAKMRMDRAALLLRHSILTISEIAEAVGYSDAFAFSTAFKRILGMAPSHYRHVNSESRPN